MTPKTHDGSSDRNSLRIESETKFNFRCSQRNQDNKSTTLRGLCHTKNTLATCVDQAVIYLNRFLMTVLLCRCRESMKFRANKSSGAICSAPYYYIIHCCLCRDASRERKRIHSFRFQRAKARIDQLKLNARIKGLRETSFFSADALQHKEPQKNIKFN